MMESGLALGAIAFITKRYQSTKQDTLRLANPLTYGAFTIAPITIAETGGDGESMTRKKNLFKAHIDGGGPYNSRWNETEIGAGTTARA